MNENEQQEPSTTILDKITEVYGEETLLKADGFDDAIIGVDESSMRLIYSVSKCIDILKQDMSEEDALEHFIFNVSGAYIGYQTQIWCHDDFQIDFPLLK